VRPAPAEGDTATVSRRFEELDRRPTRIGEISLRRRLEPSLQVDVYEARLDDEFLMSSLFTVAEVELARLALAQLAGTDLDVVVGGLGLGYTALAVLEDRRVRSLTVVEALGEVIEWHQRGMLPFASALTSDRRCHLVEGDFFATVAGDSAFGGDGADRCHAVLVDIDHSPRHHLDRGHARFYEPDGLRHLSRHLHPGGVFALWSDDDPHADFLAAMEEVFPGPRAHVISFPNPYTGRESANTVYVAIAPGGRTTHLGVRRIDRQE
jgi:spermidine synthase